MYVQEYAKMQQKNPAIDRIFFTAVQWSIADSNRSCFLSHKTIVSY